MESTLLHSFLRASKLKRWLARIDCPQVFREIKELFDKLYAPKIRDSDGVTEEDDEAQTSTRSTPHDLQSILGSKSDRISMRARLKHNGVVFSVASTHAGNSQIYFYPDGKVTAPPVAGSIQYIYNAGIGTRLAIRCQQSLPDHISDPFSRYPHFPAKLHCSRLSGALEEVDPAWIYCHYARWVMNDDYAVILKLIRVSIF